MSASLRSAIVMVLAGVFTAPLAPSWADGPSMAPDAADTASQPNTGVGDQQQTLQPEDTNGVEDHDEGDEADDIAAEQEEDEAMAEYLDVPGATGAVPDSGTITQGLDSEYMDDEAGQVAPDATTEEADSSNQGAVDSEAEQALPPQ